MKQSGQSMVQRLSHVFYTSGLFMSGSQSCLFVIRFGIPQLAVTISRKTYNARRGFIDKESKETKQNRGKNTWFAVV